MARLSLFSQRLPSVSYWPAWPPLWTPCATLSWRPASPPWAPRTCTRTSPSASCLHSSSSRISCSTTTSAPQASQEGEETGLCLWNGGELFERPLWAPYVSLLSFTSHDFVLKKFCKDVGGLELYTCIPFSIARFHYLEETTRTASIESSKLTSS